MGPPRREADARRRLSPTPPPRTSSSVAKPLFDMALRAMRRDRAFRQGPALFLLDRTFDDALERIALVNRRFESALLIGCANPEWPNRLADLSGQVEATDPGRLFASAAKGERMTEDEDRLGDENYDLCVAIGTLDTVNNLPLTLANIRAALRPDSLFLGAISGGDTLPVLRSAMRAADAANGGASPHVHPRIDGPSLCDLLGKVGLVNAVVDVDRVPVAYPSLQSEVADLRAMAATNILTERPINPLGRKAFRAAANDFASRQDSGRTVETFEILHFAAWTPESEPRSDRL